MALIKSVPLNRDAQGEISDHGQEGMWKPAGMLQTVWRIFSGQKAIVAVLRTNCHIERWLLNADSGKLAETDFCLRKEWGAIFVWVQL